MGFSIVFHFSASNANNSADFQESLNFLEYSCIFYCIWICTAALLEFFFVDCAACDWWRYCKALCDSNPSGPLINRLKYFLIRFRFRQDIRIFEKLRGVHPNAESSSAVCIITQSQGYQLSQKQLSGVHPTAESSSAVCFQPRSQALWCASNRRVKLRGVHHTVESNCTPRCQNRNLWESLVAFKGAIRRIPFFGVKYSIM